MFGNSKDGLKARRVYDEIVNYLESGQEKISYPDRSATNKLMWRRFKAPKHNSTHKKVEAIEQQPHYFKHVKNLLEGHQSKAQSIDKRNQIIERQNRLNYTLELERINGILSQTTPGLRHDSIEHLKQRKKVLEDLGSVAVE